MRMFKGCPIQKVNNLSKPLTHMANSLKGCSVVHYCFISFPVEALFTPPLALSLEKRVLKSGQPNNLFMKKCYAVYVCGGCSLIFPKQPSNLYKGQSVKNTDYVPDAEFEVYSVCGFGFIGLHSGCSFANARQTSACSMNSDLLSPELRINANTFVRCLVVIELFYVHLSADLPYRPIKAATVSLTYCFYCVLDLSVTLHALLISVSRIECIQLHENQPFKAPQKIPCPKSKCSGNPAATLINSRVRGSGIANLRGVEATTRPLLKLNKTQKPQKPRFNNTKNLKRLLTLLMTPLMTLPRFLLGAQPENVPVKRWIQKPESIRLTFACVFFFKDLQAF